MHKSALILSLQIVSYTGAVLVIAGDLARKIAIVTAAENFDHLVQSEKADNHKVIKKCDDGKLFELIFLGGIMLFTHLGPFHVKSYLNRFDFLKAIVAY